MPGSACLLLALSACAHTSGHAGAWPTLAERAPAPSSGPAPARALLPAPTPLPAPGQSPSLALRELLTFAEHHSPLLAVARARTRQGDAELEGAEVLLQNNPELRVSTGPRARAGARGLDVSVSLEQRFEIAGERGLRIRAAEQLRDLTRLELEEARWLVHRQVHAAFHAALVARERVAATAQVLELTERMLEIARRRQASGDVSALDVRVAENELAQARQAQIAAKAEFHSARLLLAELSGWPEETAPEPAGSLEQPRRPAAPAHLLELARRNNPTLRAHAQAALAAEARVKLADREAWPEPSLGLSYARESEPGGGPGSEANIGLVTLGLPLPIWQRNQGDRARARADALVANAERAAFERALAAQVTRAAAAMSAAAERVAAYGREIIPGFERNLELLQRSFELGEMDLLQLMVTRGRFLEVERDALSAYADYYDELARLEELVGAELWPDEHHDAERASEKTP